MPEPNVDALVRSADVAGLLALASSADARLAKAARRGLHRLRSAGVAVPEPGPAQRPAPTSSTTPSAKELPSLATSADGAGERLVWLMRRTDQGAHVFQARVHEEHGLLDFWAVRWPVRRARALGKEILAMTDLPSAEVPSDWARWLIEEAYERTLARKRAVPSEFVHARADLGAAPCRFPEHPAVTHVPPAEEAGEREMRELHRASCCAGWAPERDEIDRLALRLDEVRTSRLVLGDVQRAERREATVRLAVTEYFTPERRARFALRLLDAAYVMHLAGDEKRAGVARAAADALLDPSLDVERQPFAMELFAKLLRALDHDEEPEEPEVLAKAPALIVPGNPE
jgi:hypothetical protein